MLESYTGMVNEILEDFSPEERHQIYKLLRLDVYACADQPLEIRGIFAILGDEAETTVCRPANSRREAFPATNPWPSNSAHS